MPFAASPRCELGSSRGQPRAKVSPLTPRCSLCTHTSEPRMVVPRATTTSPGTWERATRPAPTAWGTHGSSQLAGCRCGCRRVGNCLETAPPAVARCCRPMLVLPGTPLGRWWPETCPSGPLPADPPCSPPPPLPGPLLSKRFPSSCIACLPQGATKNPENWISPPETRSGAPQDWRGALAPLRMCAMRAAGVSRYTSSRAPSTARLRHNTGRGKFPKPRENALSYPPRGRLGVRPTSRRAGAPTGVRPVRLPGRGRQGPTGAREAGRGGAVGAWRGAAG